jgi:type I restriction enzyme R subunit
VLTGRLVVTTDTTERGLERLICTALTGGPCHSGRPQAEGRGEAASPSAGVGWICGNSNDYDREYAVDLAQLLAFLVETQPDAFEGLCLEDDGPARRKFLPRLQGEPAEADETDEAADFAGESEETEA